MNIGFLDSGLGGVTVLSEALRSMPDEDYLYYADTLHVPYGEKPKEEVKRHIFDAVEFMVGEGIKALVVACNTATSIAVKELRQTYPFPIIGMEPAVKPAVKKSAGVNKRVLVFATSLTLKEAKFRQLVSAVDPNHLVDIMALPGLVELAERLTFDGEEAEAYLHGKLSEFDIAEYGTVVLGCTHFPLFSGVLRRVLPERVELIDGAAGTVKHLKTQLEKNGLRTGGSGKLFFRSSGDRDADSLRFQTALSHVLPERKLIVE